MNLALHLATFGRDRCNWIDSDTWATEHRAPTKDDLCGGPRTWYIEVDLGDQTILTHVCDKHLDVVGEHAKHVYARPAKG